MGLKGDIELGLGAEIGETLGVLVLGGVAVLAVVMAAEYVEALAEGQVESFSERASLLGQSLLNLLPSWLK